MAKKKIRREIHPQSELLEGLDSKKLALRLSEGRYSGINDDNLRKALGQKKKAKKSKLASDLLSSRRKQEKQKDREHRQSELEKKRIKDLAIAIIDVSKEDKEAFILAIDESSRELRNFMLKKLAATQFGVSSALDTVLQELNILMEGGVVATAMVPFAKLNAELALVAITKKMCKLYGLDPITTRKVINAKIEFMRPAEFRPVNPTGYIPEKRQGAVVQGKTDTTKR